MDGWLKDGAEQSCPCYGTLLARKHAVRKARNKTPSSLSSINPPSTHLDQPRQISVVVDGKPVVVATRPRVPEAAPTLLIINVE